MTYYFWLSIWVYINKPKKVPGSMPKTKFLVLIPAVNEETVIKVPIQDLLCQKYPKTSYDIYVIADHCTDNTAKVAARYGAKVITEDTNPEAARYGIGKSATLDYGLHCVPNWQDYDYLLVIDSDNQVSPNLLQRLLVTTIK